MDDIIDAAQVMFEEDGISQETVNELRSVGLHFLLTTGCCTLLDVSSHICTALSVLSIPEVFHRRTPAYFTALWPFARVGAIFDS